MTVLRAVSCSRCFLDLSLRLSEQSCRFNLCATMRLSSSMVGGCWMGAPGQVGVRELEQENVSA